MSVLSFAKIISLVLALMAATMVLPIGAALYHGEGALVGAFALPMGVILAAALLVHLAGKGQPVKISSKDGYLAVTGCWVFASLFGAVPFVLSGAIPRLSDALFEAVSGITTTGGTILTDVEAMPVCINLWRCQLHWLGGMGIIALTVALMPLLGIGGFQLIRAETSGLEKAKFTAKVADTAKVLWGIYMVLTAAEIAALLMAGLSVTDALAQAFSNLAAGGFSTKTQSIGGFGSTAVNVICTVFMILAGINFALFYNLVTRRFLPILRDSEFRAYCVIIAAASIALTLCITPLYGTIKAAVGPALFHTASVLTTTGFAFADYTQWGSSAQAIILILMCIGGCSGSTAGGVKVVRWVIVVKQIGARFRSLGHPAQSLRNYPITLNKRTAGDDLVYTLGAYFFLYAVLAAVTCLAAAFSGADLLTSLGTSLALLGNVGIGLGRVGPAGNFAFYPALAKLWFCVVMIAGRLELFTVVLVFVRKR